ncbi:MAG: peptidoglycan-binding domain-containing protein, partial [Miltoncostaeaceae bacterium]
APAPAVAPALVQPVLVDDALRQLVVATWAATGRATDGSRGMWAARVEGVLWVMADMGVPGFIDMQVFHEAAPGVLEPQGAVVMQGMCPGIPLALREAWGFAPHCTPGDPGVPLPGSVPVDELPEPVQGTGMWIWYVNRSERSLDALIARAKANGIRTVHIKSGDGTDYWSQFDRAVGPLKAAGLRVCAWQYVRGRRPVAEAAVAARAVRAGADCFMVDAEVEFERLRGRYARATRYMRALRARVGAAYPVGLTTFPYVDLHGRFPYSAFLTGPDAAQFTMPQVYWRAHRVSPEAAVDRTMRGNRVYGKPIALLGGTYMRETPAQIRRFRCASQSAGVKGESWWAWQNTRRAQWPALGSPLSCGLRLARREGSRYPYLGMRSRGDVVRRLQSLLRSQGLPVPVTGVFGARTRDALAAYRAARGLPPVAGTDDVTWADLLARSGSPATPAPG